jgi:hypothetical protein
MQIEARKMDGKKLHSIPLVGRQVIFVVFFALIDFGFKYVSLGIATLESVIASIMSGVLLSVVLGFIFSNFSYRRRTRIGVAWLSLFIIQFFSNFVEAVFFTTSLPDVMTFAGACIVGLIVSLLEAALTGLLFFSDKTNSSLKTTLAQYFNKSTKTDWVKRVLIGSIAYFPIYYTFGSIIAPLVLGFYNDPTQGTGLVVPSLSIIIPLEVFRGLLFIVALIPIIASLKVSRRTMLLCLTSFIYLVGAFVPFIAYSTLPLFLRLVHGAEILADSIAYSAVLNYLFNKWPSNITDYSQ